MKTRLFLIIAVVLLAGSLSAQENKASVQLAAAIYEEEVTGNLDKAVELYLNILKITRMTARWRQRPYTT